MAGSAPVCVIPNNKVTSRKPCCSGDWLCDWLGNFSSAQDFAIESSPATCLFSLSFLVLLFSSITLFTPFPMSLGFVDFYRAHGPMALSRYRMISITVLSNLPSFCKQAESPKKVGLRIKQTCFVLEKHGPAGQNAIAPVGCLHWCEASLENSDFTD